MNNCVNKKYIVKSDSVFMINLVPRVLSYPPYGARERETLENAGHVPPRNWEIYKQTSWGRGR